MREHQLEREQIKAIEKAGHEVAQAILNGAQIIADGNSHSMSRDRLIMERQWLIRQYAYFASMGEIDVKNALEEEFGDYG